MLLKLVWVAVGSAAGGVCRYLLSKAVSDHWAAAFPWGTFVVNMLGCLAIGLIYGLIDSGVHLSPELRLLLITGFCGGFTTFSTFVHENHLLFQSDHPLLLAAYAAASFFCGLLLIHAAYSLTAHL